jgi:SAM-dependent methyltransferase
MKKRSSGRLPVSKDPVVKKILKERRKKDHPILSLVRMSDLVVNVNGKLSRTIQAMLKERTVKLDIGCGPCLQPGWIGIDKFEYPNVIKHDLEVYPWPLPSDSIDFALGSHIAEHINPIGGGFIRWMDEIWRVLRVEASLVLAMPYAGSPGYWHDPTHCNGCTEHTWRYFDPMDPSGYYFAYKPKPWKVSNVSFDVTGYMEVAMSKRMEDPSYYRKVGGVAEERVKGITLNPRD